MSVIVVSTGPRTAASLVPRPLSAIGEQAPSLRPERAGWSLSLVETVRVDSPSGRRRGRAEVGQAASLPAAPAGAKSAGKAIPTRLAACPTLACARRQFRSWGAWLLGLVAGAGLAWAQGTAFSYQGQLTDGAAAANGTYDLRFTLWNTVTAGDPQGATLTQAGVGVTNGLFTATLDFGAQFTGAARWLEIAVRTNGAATFTTLAERQPVLPTPYAIHAATATTATTATTVTGSVPVSQLTGTLASAQIPDLDASKITTGTLAAARIPNIDASKVTTGTFATAQIPDLDAAKITSGTFTGNGSGLVSLNASALSSGTVPVARIPNLDAAKVTTGTFATARIPTLAAGQIPNLDASKITSGTVTDGRLSANIPRLDGSPVMASDLDLDAHKLLLMPVVSEVLRYRAGGAYGVAGPVLSGTAGGVLATGDGISGLERAVLLWREDGSVNVPGGITAGTISGNGAGLTSLNASALNTGTVADARLSANVALKNGSPAFTAAAGTRVASFTGSRTGGNGSAVAHVENTETGTSASPALRVLGRGTANDGALSVSADAGRIARFGNLTDWVAVLDNDGKFSATAFITLSDRNKKTGFAPVDVEAVLAKVALLPLTTWHYTNDAAATPHLGPMAQDFHAAFGLGGDDKTIATVDADGVALAAIQGLNHRTEALAAENAAIREELARQQTANADLRDELGDLRALVRQLQQQLNANRP